jgi:uncharacterized SAM-dependent methyltransferase
MELVNFQLEKNGETAYITALDINYTFLRDFANALKDKTKEVPDRKISFVGIQSLFEKVPSLNSNYTATKRKLHICLGNTLGNYEKTTDIMAIFLKHMSKNDYLLLGFQTNRLLKFIKKRYFGNQYLQSLFVSSLPIKFHRAMKKEGVEWRYDEKKGQVEAWLGNVQIFRSKKFNPHKLQNILRKYGFVLKHEFKDDFATCLHLYRYVGQRNDI